MQATIEIPEGDYCTGCPCSNLMPGVQKAWQHGCKLLHVECKTDGNFGNLAHKHPRCPAFQVPEPIPDPNKLIGEELKRKLPIGCTVSTIKGNKKTGVFYGEVIGYSSYRRWFDVKIKKWNGKIVMCHAINLVRFK